MRGPQRTRARDDERGGRISWIEVIGYTAVILLIGLLATGWFDVMMPWK